MNLPPIVRMLLWPISLLYGCGARLRAWLYTHGWLKQERLKAPVISVGNLTVGGTGKTPMVIWLAEQLLADGKHIAILSRGYHGSNGTSDEIELMKLRLQGRVAFGVGKNRFAKGQRLENTQPIDVFLLDDGFQHLRLRRDLNILLMDASRPLHGEALLPAGRLREPVSAMSRANLVVFTRAEMAPGAQEAIAKLSTFPVFAASTRLQGFRRFGGEMRLQSAGEIGAGPFLPFCGLGNPEGFWNDLARWHVPVAAKKAFRDHHRYSNGDVTGLERAAEQAGAKAFITTEKDEQNLTEAQSFKRPVHVAVIDFVLSSESECLAAIDRVLASRLGAVA